MAGPQEETVLDPVKAIDAFDLLQRQRRFIVQGQLLASHFSEPMLPFAELPVIRFCLNLPLDQRKGLGFYTRAIRELYPRLARVLDTGSYAPVSGGKLLRTLGSVARIGETLGKRELRRLSKGRLNLRNWYDFAHYQKWITEEPLRSWVEDILGSKEFRERGIFMTEAVERLWENTLKGEGSVTLVFLILTLELWLRAFVDAGARVDLSSLLEETGAEKRN